MFHSCHTSELSVAGEFTVWELESLHHLPRFLPGACALSLGEAWTLCGFCKGIKFPCCAQGLPVELQLRCGACRVRQGPFHAGGGSSVPSQFPDIHCRVLDLPGQWSCVCRLSAWGLTAREGMWQLTSGLVVCSDRILYRLIFIVASRGVCG